MCKDCQGLGLPPGVRGKGTKGRGQGTQLVTSEKPLPLPGVSRVFLICFLTDLKGNLHGVSSDITLTSKKYEHYNHYYTKSSNINFIIASEHLKFITKQCDMQKAMIEMTVYHGFPQYLPLVKGRGFQG